LRDAVVNKIISLDKAPFAPILEEFEEKKKALAKKYS